MSTTLDELRENNQLKLEDAIDIDLQICAVEEPFKFLESSDDIKTCARVDLTCSRYNRLRKIKTDWLENIDQKDLNPNGDLSFTHFVAMVTEGGVANISIRKQCASESQVIELTEIVSRDLFPLTPHERGKNSVLGEFFCLKTDKK